MRHVALLLAAVLVTALSALAVVTLAGDDGERSAGHQERGSKTEDGEQGSEVEERTAQEGLRFRHAQLVDDSGEIPSGAVVEATDQAERLRSSGTTARRGPAGIVRGTWNPLGPGNVGGRTRSLVIDPGAPQTLYAGAVTGGILKTTNGGASWRTLDDFIANLRVATLVLDPRDPRTLYAGTGESFSSDDGIAGAGVFKTKDGGSTWTQLPATATPDFDYVNRLAIDPVDSRNLLAATGTGLWRSKDAGATWAQSLTGSSVLDLRAHPSDPAKAVAAGSGEAFWTTDGGVSWTAATGLPDGAGRVELSYAPSAPQTVYASVDDDPSQDTSGQVYRSTDGGQSYELQGDVQHLETQGDYGNAIWVDPLNASRIVVGGIDLWRSIDAGVNFTKISNWQDDASVHADQHGIIAPPGYGPSDRSVYVVNDGGIYRSANIATAASTTGWSKLNNRYPVTQFYSGAITPSGRLLGGTQDNGTPATGGDPDAWVQLLSGDGGEVAADPTSSKYVYGEYVNLQIFRNSDGATSDAASEDIWGTCAKPLPYRIPDACGNAPNSLFIAPFVLDPNNAQRLLGGGASLWRTNNARAAVTATTGPSWSQVKAPLAGVSGGDGLISAVAVAPGNANRVWVGYQNGQVWATANATASTPTWAKVSAAGMPARPVLRLVVDPRATATVYAAFGGFATGNLWVTADSGATWTARTGAAPAALPDAPVRSIAINPTDSSRIYAGTEVGVFASEDGGATWGTPQDGPANVSADQLFFGGTKLYDATFGRGMFSTDVAATRPSNDAFEAPQDLTGPDASRGGDSNIAATMQSGEPEHADKQGGASIWYRWTPAVSGPTVVDTRGSGLDTTLAVYTGESLRGLRPVAGNDDEASGMKTSRVGFDAVAGTTYRIAVDGTRSGSAAATGTVLLHLAETVPPVSLSVSRSGNGSGTVTSDPAGIACGASCSAGFPSGTTVVLTATPAAGSSFAGWSGDCSGTGTCQVPLSAPRSVTAAFAGGAPGGSGGASGAGGPGSGSGSGGSGGSGSSGKAPAAPQLVLGGSMSQKALRAKAVLLTARVDQPASLVVSSSLKLAGKITKLPAVTANAVGGRTVSLRLVLPKAAQSRLKRALGRRKSCTATVSVTARSASGKFVTAKRVIRLVR